jgi:transcriptional regulator with XRE-family HTH domain
MDTVSSSEWEYSKPAYDCQQGILGSAMRLSDLARNRLIQWMDANPKIVQAEIAAAVGHGQGWVSKYRQEQVEASVDELDAMARVFGHTLTELLDLRADTKERALLDAYRRIRAEARPLALSVIQEMGQGIRRARTRQPGGG